jgi:hypothetical protein
MRIIKNKMARTSSVTIHFDASPQGDIRVNRVLPHRVAVHASGIAARAHQKKTNAMTQLAEQTHEARTVINSSRAFILSSHPLIEPS